MRRIIDISLMYPFLLGLSLLSLTRNFPFKELSPFILIFFVLALVITQKQVFANFLGARKHIQILSIGYIFIFTAFLEYSFIRNNIFSYALNTYGCILLLLISYFTKRDIRLLKIFLWVMILHSLVLIGIELFMIFNFEVSFNSEVRAFFRENEFGDIYPINDSFFRIILKGNELLPIALMVAQFICQRKTKIINSTLFLLGIIIAGNFVYFISLMFFLIAYLLYKKKIKTCLFLVIFILMSLVLFSTAFQDLMAEKNEYSLPTRMDQFQVLIYDMESSYDILAGKGLGNIVNERTGYRNYTDVRYYELQTIYFYNQLGFIFFFLLIISHLIMTIEYMNSRRILIIYTCYLCYAITNPYILNFDQIFVIVILLTLKDYFAKEKANLLVKDEYC